MKRLFIKFCNAALRATKPGALVLFACLLGSNLLSVSFARSPSQVIEGVILRVVDGDTVLLVDDSGTKHMIRLAGIDAPETRMAFGDLSKKALMSLTMHHRVSAISSKRDKYGRSIATLYAGGSDVNLKLIQLGFAWHYTQYAREQTKDDAHSYAETEQAARAQRVGLWQDESPIPPWEWRHCHHAACKGLAW